jgi:signal transduction histidine kinase
MNSSSIRSSQVYLSSERNTEFEKYASLINIFKGFEEYTLDTQGVIVSSNLEAVNITGWDEWEVMGKNVSVLYPIEDQLTGKPCEDLAKSEKRGSIVFTSLWMKKRNSSFLARIKITALKDNEVLTGYKMTLQDSTYKAVNNQRIKKIRDEYLSLFNNSFVGIVKFNMHDFQIFMMNEKAERMICSAGDREKLKFNEIFDSPTVFSTLLNKLNEAKKVDDFEFRLKNSDQWLLTSLRYFANEDFAEGILMNVTDVRNKDNEIVRLNHELDQFIYHASHELRSPLVSMLGLINLIKLEQKAVPGPSGEDYVALLENKVNKLDNLLKKIVAITYNNKAVVSNDSIDWHELVTSCLRDSEIRNERVRIEMNIVQDSEFVNDKDRTRIVISNLLSNAMKYYNTNVSDPNVVIKISSDGSEANILISDNGVGIDRKYLKNIFGMFYRAHVSPSDGNGLGLYVVRTMIERIGGQITVTSNLGEGTSFQLIIPNKMWQSRK